MVTVGISSAGTTIPPVTVITASRGDAEGVTWSFAIDCPAWEHTTVSKTTGVSGSADTVEEVHNTIRSRFKAKIQDPHGIPVLYDNMPDPIPPDGLWVRFSIRLGGTFLVGNPLRYRTPGLAFAMILSPALDGDRAAFDLVDAIDLEFRSVKVKGIVFKTPSPKVIGRDGNSKWWQINVRMPFYYDHQVTV